MSSSRWIAAATALAVSAGVCSAFDARLATYNIQAMGAEGGAEYRALVEILGRIDADVVMLQEVDVSEVGRVDDLAAETGYGFHCVSETSGTLSGGLHTAVLSRFPLTACESWSAAELSGDPSANDITRDVLETHVEIGAGLAEWGVFTVHLKAGSSAPDLFRRQVELIRVVSAIDDFRTRHPGSPISLAGDFNEDVGDGPFGVPVYTTLPPGLPPSYHLGSDISFPVVYDPFRTLEDEGLAPVEAFHEDDPADASTRWLSGRRLDYHLEDETHVGVGGSEVYDACDDNGVDDPPAGNWLPKAGVPLSCGTEMLASDHLAVFCDLERLAVDQDRDGIDDAVDCDPLDAGAGRPGPIVSLLAGKLPGGGAHFFWDAAPTADRYDLIGGSLPPFPVASASCRTPEDGDPGDTVFDDEDLPAARAPRYLLVRGVDAECGGPGGYESGHAEPDRTNTACDGPNPSR